MPPAASILCADEAPRARKGPKPTPSRALFNATVDATAGILFECRASLWRARRRKFEERGHRRARRVRVDAGEDSTQWRRSQTCRDGRAPISARRIKWGEGKEAKESRTAIRPCDVRPQKTSYETRLFSATVSRRHWKIRVSPWWAHQGSSQGGRSTLSRGLFCSREQPMSSFYRSTSALTFRQRAHVGCMLLRQV
jgi:hypothetical protein